MDKLDFPGNILSSLNPAALGGVAGGVEAKKARDSKTSDRSKNGKSIQGNQKTMFHSVLDMLLPSRNTELGALQETAPSEEAVQELLDEVHSAGDDLKDRPFPEEILRYKKAVRNFLHYVVENGYDVKREEYRFRQQTRVKTLVQVVDQKLEQLAAGILANQTNQLELLSRLEEIKGLLVDLVS
jgi:uncharacterized protein YaaR (DUF327 family)